MHRRAQGYQFYPALSTDTLIESAPSAELPRARSSSGHGEMHTFRRDSAVRLLWTSHKTLGQTQLTAAGWAWPR